MSTYPGLSALRVTWWKDSAFPEKRCPVRHTGSHNLFYVVTPKASGGLRLPTNPRASAQEAAASAPCTEPGAGTPSASCQGRFVHVGDGQLMHPLCQSPGPEGTVLLWVNRNASSKGRTVMRRCDPLPPEILYWSSSPGLPLAVLTTPVLQPWGDSRTEAPTLAELMKTVRVLLSAWNQETCGV